MKHNPGFLKLVDAARTRVKECTVVQAKARLDHGEPLHFLDVREDHEFSKDHAKGARHLGKGIIERDVETLIPNKEDAILLYCGGGYRSRLSCGCASANGLYQRGVDGWGDQRLAGCGLSDGALDGTSERLRSHSPLTTNSSECAWDGYLLLTRSNSLIT